MMKKLPLRTLTSLLCALCTTTAVRAAEPNHAPQELPDTVTFSEHIAPIIFNNCTRCHRPGELSITHRFPPPDLGGALLPSDLRDRVRP